MNPIDPLLPTKPAGTTKVIFAKDQPEYNPLPAEVTPAGAVVTRWAPTAEERALLVAGVDVYVSQLTFGTPLQPLLVTVGPPQHLLPGG